MGSKDKFFSITSADKGTDNLGIAQASGTISAIGDAKTLSQRFAGKLAVTLSGGAVPAGTIVKGQPIQISNLDAGHNGLTRVLAVLLDGTNTNITKLIVNITYNPLLLDAAGNWDIQGGASAWDAFMPVGADLPAANVALTFWDPNKQGGQETLTNFTQNKVYVFPGIIKTIKITTAGNVVLFRAATLRPWGKDAQ